ncbi:secretory phospholipase A2 [Moelleriella libera RCEF 2490]|uniref:Secretory phospholipase A2 n=1 Tax=Moelleriella libera RCEF 2490 TaxID=1081109 RepID=A0A166V6Z4_9HYPO|nr:secretory phospholipase A2 [Moelleriella libera RCEF 2490]
MKVLASAIVILLPVMVSALPAANSTPTPATPQQLEGRSLFCNPWVADTLIFRMSMDNFQNARGIGIPFDCDWTSDGCSLSPDKPAGFDFTESCYRHDFAYRNTKAQNRFTGTMRKSIDVNFRKDLYNYCRQFATASGWFNSRQARCRRVADFYYVAVRRFGMLKAEGKAGGVVGGMTLSKDSVLNMELDEDIPGQQIPEVWENDDSTVNIQALAQA